jgi:hypothetical protein
MLLVGNANHGSFWIFWRNHIIMLLVLVGVDNVTRPRTRIEAAENDQLVIAA